MPPITINRRRFLSCSAAAGLALSHGLTGEAAGETAPIRLGVIGLGTRGTSLLRSLLELPGVRVVAVCDSECRHRARASGIVAKTQGAASRPVEAETPAQVFDRADVDAVAIALPCDLHFPVYREAIRASKHLYAEKPLALTVADCDSLIVESVRRPEVQVHVGFQRRSNPRYREGAALVHGGELGEMIEGNAAWVSSNGPMNGYGDWLARRARSGDWMIEQAVHVWDVYNWLAGGPPARAFGQGRRDLFARSQPRRDVTDHYSVQLEWANGFHVSFLHSWVAPADDRFTGVTQQVMGALGGFDFSSGALTFRDKCRPRRIVHPETQPDTRFALQTFLDAVRSGGAVPPPLTLSEARAATLTGLLVRKAVDERRVVTLEEATAEFGV